MAVGGRPGPVLAAPAAVTASVEAPSQPGITSFAQVVALAEKNRDIQMKAALERDVRLVRFDDGTIEFELAPGASPVFAQTLMRKLGEWTGRRWMVSVVPGGGAPSLREQAQAAARAEKQAAADHPLVRRVLDMFPGSEIVGIRGVETAAVAVSEREEPAAPNNDDDIGYEIEAVTDDDL
jgi:DNA polymerase III subunit gamma/tau